MLICSVCWGVQAGKVLDVMQAGDKRVVLVTDKDVALLRLRIVSLRSTYRPMWFVRLSSIQTVRGELAALQSCFNHDSEQDNLPHGLLGRAVNACSLVCLSYESLMGDTSADVAQLCLYKMG